MLELTAEGKRVWASGEHAEKLEKACVGVREGDRLLLGPEEALYALQFQNGSCTGAKGEELGFSALAARLDEPRLLTAYSAYRDWRDRGLVARRDNGESGVAAGTKAYPSKPFIAPQVGAPLQWQGAFAMVEDAAAAAELFEKHWFGQRGVYKQERGELLALDWMEAAFLAKHAGASVVDARGKRLGWEAVVKAAEQEYANELFEVYEDWRLHGFVVKTGFKFGTHFRIYFPGARPKATGEAWTHSKHVVHVFPKEQQLLVSEWARAVRVAHGVRKTFLLAIPELRESDRAPVPAGFVAWRRKKKGGDWVRESPKDPARHLLVPLSEDDRIGGLELATLLRAARSRGLELLLAITDRETAITHYVLKEVQLPGSTQSYYEIEWVKP